ncbi:hypothetical protein FGIG_10128 [Fasciola gigantica]|uniref:Uncharacterized protein n=1 Tax=Fasciola gigantica TaxID=46835 RepID=A0A504YUB9_FASGI|nr:hypothetical protein FGIG_10128 [Fasciola gigantica]
MGSTDSFRTPSFNSIPELSLCQGSAGCISGCPSTYSYAQTVQRSKPECNLRISNSHSPYNTQIPNSFCFDSAVMSRNSGCVGSFSISNASPLCDSTQIPFSNEPLATSSGTVAVTTTVGKARSRRRTRSGTQQLKVENSKSQDSPLSLSTKSKITSSEEDSKSAVSPCSSSEVNSNSKDDRYLQRRMHNNRTVSAARFEFIVLSSLN